MANITVFRKGQTIMHKDAPWLITDMQFTSPGKGSAFYRLKLKNLQTSQGAEVTVKSGEALEEANVFYKNAQFLYKDNQEYFFMDTETYDQFSLNEEDLGDQYPFLQEGAICKTTYLEGRAVAIALPIKMDFKVKSTIPGVKGDTATGGTKPITLENDVVIKKAPLFIKEGDLVRINTETGEYVERIS